MARDIIIIGHLGGDAAVTILKADGSVVHLPCNKYDDVRRATQIKDPELRQAACQAPGDYLRSRALADILGLGGSVAIL